jgi:hypothetical protein
MKAVRRVGELLAMGLATASLLSAPAVRAANVQDLVRETQHTAQSNGEITMVWWMPYQFWEESMKANPALTAEARAQVLAPLADYSLFALLRAKIGAAGMSDVQPKAELIKNLKLQVNGKIIEPLAPEAISPGAQLLLSQLKPALGAMAGQFGQSLEFVVFPARADGKTLIDAAQVGTMQVNLYEQSFKWRTPLGSLLPARIDAKTGEEFPGNYGFNPYTGEKLGTKK